MRLLERAAFLMLAVMLALATMGASDPDARSAALSKQMMCTCGCAQILGECNHVGCPNAPGLLAALHTDVAKGMSDKAVLLAFEQKYGPTVLASPMFTRLNQVAWFIPAAILLFGLLAAALTTQRWRNRSGAESPAAVAVPQARQDDALARVRRDTERL